MLLYFGGCDYFRLSRHHAVRAGLMAGLRAYGLNVAASRQTTGNHAVYEELEADLAGFFGAEAAVLVPSGYVTNLAVAQALTGEFTHAFLDARAHASLVDAAMPLGCPVIEFAHRDASALKRQLRRVRGRIRPLLMTDGMFPEDGSVAPLRAYLEVLPPEAILLVDDAHGAGVLGQTGRGTPEFAGVARARVIQTATLSKAFGVYGGVILGSGALRSKLRTRSRVLAGGTPLPLPLVVAARAAVRVLARDASFRRRLLRNANHLQARLRDGGWPLLVQPGPIIQIVPSSDREAHRLQRALLRAGIHPPLIRYGAAVARPYFRFAVSSEHNRPQLDALADVLIRHARSRLGTRLASNDD